MYDRIISLNRTKNALDLAWKHAIAAGAYEEAGRIADIYKVVAHRLEEELHAQFASKEMVS